MDYAASRQGYLNLWKKAQLRPERAASARGIAKRIMANRDRYEKISVQVNSVPWWWIAAIHNLEASGNFAKYLGNGQPFTQRTTIVPKGRGPFVSFEAGAVDAIRLKGLHKIPEWDITRALYEAERYNGFGYVGKINSPYLWSFTTLQQKGKYVRDHVWDPNYVSQQCGVAAIFKALEELGALEVAKTPMEDNMAELRASLLPFGALAPILIRTLAGPAANLALKAITEALGGDSKTPAEPQAVKEKLEEAPLRELPTILATAEAILKELGIADPMPDPPVPSSPLPGTVPADPAAPPAQVVVQPVAVPSTTTVVVSPEKDDELGIVDRIFGGKYFAGLKTPAGVLIYCAAWAASALGYITPEVTSALYALATALAGVGIVAKIDKVLPWLASLTAVIKRK